MPQTLSPIALIRSHWRTFLPLWLSPVILAVFVLIGDFFPESKLPAFLVILAAALPMWIGIFFLTRFKRTTGTPFPTLYLVWLAPCMVLWIAFVLARAAILIFLQKPL
jgi:hypothetical protein